MIGPPADYLEKKTIEISTVLVIQAGFEPTTRSLEGCCSIQLSYWTRIEAAKLKQICLCPKIPFN